MTDKIFASYDLETDVAANRPVTPTVSDGRLYVFVATDTDTISIWDGAVWASFKGTNTGDQTITLTGDVTGSGTGSFAATIANDAVTYAKIQNVTDVRLLGRSAGSAGDVQEITVGTGLSLAAGALTSTVTSYTDEQAQDAVGAMVDGTIIYTDATPLLSRAALTGDATAPAGSNAVTVVSVANVTTGKIKPANGGSGAVLIAFNAANTVGQSVSSGVFTKCTLGNEIFDTNNNFASNRFTCTIAGYYFFGCQLRVTDSVAVGTAIASFFLNGAEAVRAGHLNTAGNGATPSGNTILKLAVNDYVELYGYVTGTGPSFDFNSGGSNCFFSGYLIAIG